MTRKKTTAKKVAIVNQPALKRKALPKNITVAPVPQHILTHPDPRRGRYTFRPSGDIVQVEFEAGMSELFGQHYTLPLIEGRQFYKRLLGQGFKAKE